MAPQGRLEAFEPLTECHCLTPSAPGSAAPPSPATLAPCRAHRHRTDSLRLPPHALLRHTRCKRHLARAPVVAWVYRGAETVERVLCHVTPPRLGLVHRQVQLAHQAPHRFHRLRRSGSAANPDVVRIVATAHKLLRGLGVVLRDAKPYRDPEADDEELRVGRHAPRWVRMLHHECVARDQPCDSTRGCPAPSGGARGPVQSALRPVRHPPYPGLRGAEDTTDAGAAARVALGASRGHRKKSTKGLRPLDPSRR